MNPCHPHLETLSAFGCEHVTIPPALCSTQSCKLKEPRPDGNFVSCTSIYSIDNDGCKAKLQEYVRLNPCDEKRKEQVEKWDAESIQKLDYFAYALCEQVCDCIPKQTIASEYDQRKKSDTLFTVFRGNCPAHSYYDVCRVFPNIRLFRAISDSPIPDDVPKACPQLTEWFNSDESKDWPNKAYTSISTSVQTYLSSILRAMNGKEKSTWMACQNLEHLQHRI